MYNLRNRNMEAVRYIIICIVLCGGISQNAVAQKTQPTAPISQSTNKGVLPIEISAYDNTIVVHNAPVGSKLEIYSVVGIRIQEIPMKQSSGEYTVNIAKGYYIVRIADTVRKVSIR